MSAKKLFRLQIILSGLSTLLVVLAILLAYHGGLFRQLDYQLYDLHYRWRGPQPTSANIVLVLLDDQSAQELGKQKGGWSRRQTAQALTNLCQAGAEVIGLDMLYSEPGPDSEADQLLAQAMASCNNIVLARTISTQSGPAKVPLPLFQEAMIGDGFIDVPLDQDEVLRRIRFFNAKPLADGALQLLPSFALELARSYLFLDFELDFSQQDSFVLGHPQAEHIRLPYPELLINYSGDFHSFKQISFAQAVNNSFAPEDVKGKLLIIGSSLITDKDSYTTPFSKANLAGRAVQHKFAKLDSHALGQKEYGMACHAHAVETILSKRFISRGTALQVYSVTAGLALLCLLFYLPAIPIFVEYLLLSTLLATSWWGGYLLFSRSSTWFDIAPLLMVVICQFVAGMVLQKSFSKKKAAMVTNLFGRYVSGGVVKELIKGDIEATLEGQRKELTMLFSDLRNFTTMSEELGAKDTSLLLNTYFDAMIPLVFQHHGTLDKLMGDAVMAFFGAPLDVAEHSNEAALAAIAMLKTLDSLKASGQVKGVEGLDIGIGLNSGQVTVGNLGSQQFMDYTIIGDAVNLASRLEGLNKVYGTHILVSEFTAASLDHRFLLRELDLVRVKGKLQAITLYELLGLQQEFDQTTISMINQFEAALQHYRQQQWDEAEKSLLDIQSNFPDDGPTQLYLERITHYRHNPPGHDWDGITTFGHK